MKNNTCQRIEVYNDNVFLKKILIPYINIDINVDDYTSNQDFIYKFCILYRDTFFKNFIGKSNISDEIKTTLMNYNILKKFVDDNIMFNFKISKTEIYNE